MITCQFCKKKFNPALHAMFGDKGDDGSLEITTRCTHCGEIFYAYAGPTWTSARQADALIASYRKQNGGVA